MKRWTLAAALVLPLPFAALPLIAVMLGDPSPVGGSEQSVALEIAPMDQPGSAPAGAEPTSLGFRISLEEPRECGIHGES